MNDAERRVAVLDRLSDDPQRDEVIHALEVDLLPHQFEVDAVEALEAAIEVHDGNLRVLELGPDGARQIVNDGVGHLPLGVHLRAQRFVGLRLEVPEGELLELVLHLAHAEPVGDRGVDVERLLRDLDAALFGQMLERPHVVQAVGELDEDDPNVVDHRQQHLAEVLGLPLLARGERNRPDLRHAFDDVRDLGPEELGNALGGGQRVFDDVVQQAGGHGDDVQLHVGEKVRDFERVHQVRFAGVANLSLVFERREDVRPPKQLEIGLGAVAANFL